MFMPNPFPDPENLVKKKWSLEKWWHGCLYPGKWNSILSQILNEIQIFPLDENAFENYYPLFKVRSWNNGVRCMPLYILLILFQALQMVSKKVYACLYSCGMCENFCAIWQPESEL